jgi:hypothetical protein
MRREKQNEFSTYKSLHLNREVKSSRRRKQGEEDKLFVWIGGQSNDRPFRKVLRAKYLESLDIELRRMQHESPDAAKDPQWADLVRPEVERKVYDRLAQHAEELSELEEAFERSHGRTMTPSEASLYASSVLQKDPAEERPSPDSRAQTARRHWLNGIIKKVRNRHRNRPEKLQQAWAEAVGTEAAMQTSLAYVNRQKGIAYARSISPSLNQKITRNPEVLKKLGDTLGCDIQRIVFQ